MEQTGNHHIEGSANGDTIHAALLPYLAGGIALACAAIIGCLAWFGAVLLDQDTRAKRSARLIESSTRALAQESRELRDEVAKVRQELERRLSAGAPGERGDGALATATPADAAPLDRPARSALAGKSMITRAGM